MYIGHGHLVCLPLTGPGCNLGKWQGLQSSYWADLQSVNGFRCYDNIALNWKCQRVLVLTLCLFSILLSLYWYWKAGIKVYIL